MQAEIRSQHWDIAKLLEMGVNKEFLMELSPDQTRELLKGLLYVLAKHEEQSRRLE